MLKAVWKPYIPNKVVAAGTADDEEAVRIVPLLADRPQVRGHATAYVCRNYICEAPTTEPAEVVRLLARNPFPHEAPRYIRATVYEYRFTSWSEHKATGAWWKRDKGQEYLPPVSLR